MSTFYGGDQLVEIKMLDENSSSTGEKYTVPSGRYAEIYPLFTNVNGAISAEYNFDGTVQIISVEGTALSISTSSSAPFFILNEGDKLRCVANSQIYHLLIKEYLKP